MFGHGSSGIEPLHNFRSSRANAGAGRGNIGGIIGNQLDNGDREGKILIKFL